MRNGTDVATRPVGRARLTQNRAALRALAKEHRRKPPPRRGGGPRAGDVQNDCGDAGAERTPDSRSLALLTSDRGARPFRPAVAAALAVSVLAALSSEIRSIRLVAGAGDGSTRPREALRYPAHALELSADRWAVTPQGEPLKPEGGDVPETPGDGDRFREYHDQLRGRYEARSAAGWGERCLVHVHGIHHSGTGYARDLVYEGLGGMTTASKMHNTTKSQDEGQHVQGVFPSYFMRMRDKSLCLTDAEQRNPRAWGRLLYCPGMLPIAEPEKTSKQLLGEWSRYWDLSKTYLIQKTPTVDVLYLEHIGAGARIHTFHTIVMRFPFAAYPHQLYEKRSLLFLWLDIWSHLLELLAGGKVAKFAVVQYEAMMGFRARTMAEMSTLIREGCDVERAQYLNRRGRRLELRRETLKEIEKSTMKKIMAHQSACVANAICQSLMNDLAPVMAEFGYSLYAPALFQLRDTVLFSFKKPPSMELVLQMKALVTKYQNM